MSYDDRSILVESTQGRSKKVDYPGNEQPRDAHPSLYDKLSGTVFEEIRGVHPVWSP